MIEWAQRPSVSGEELPCVGCKNEKKKEKKKKKKRKRKCVVYWSGILKSFPAY